MKYTLRVSEMHRHRAGKGHVVVDPRVVESAEWHTGQVLEISYKKKKTYARLWPGSVPRGSGIIEVDGLVRHNAGAGIGDIVSVRSVNSLPAREVTLSPSEEITLEGLDGFLVRNYDNRVLGKDDEIVVGTHLGSRIHLTVVSTKPKDPVVVCDGTKFVLGKKGAAPAGYGFSYDDLGGLDDEIKKVREMVELPLRHPELFEKVGVEAPKGVLLYGPPGTGKTLLARAVAGETSAHFSHLSGPEIMGSYYGESEERIRNIFEEASKNAPAIIFIDEIDSIAPKRDDSSSSAEKTIVSQMLTLMDGLKVRGRVVVIAATNRPNSIDPALRRPGRFDREINVGIPNQQGRHEILRVHTKDMPLDDSINTDDLAKVTHGFVGADLEALSKEAAMCALRRIIPQIDMEQESVPPEILQKIKVERSDFAEALRDVRPSALREVLVQDPNVTWDDVGGLDDLKKTIQEAVEWPLKYPDEFEFVGAKAPRGILLYGEPGTGKTLVAKALAHETDSNFISIKGPELLSKWVGESEKGVREIFYKARHAAPCVIFFDEIDSLAPRRGTDTGSKVGERVVAQILAEMDGLEELHGVVVVGATNRLDMIDEALLRPGRFDRIVEVPIPDQAGREQILMVHTKDKPIADDVNIKELAAQTTGMSGARLRAITDNAALSALRRHINKKAERDSGKGVLSALRKNVKSGDKPQDIKINNKDFEDAIAEDRRHVTAPRQDHV